MSEKHPARHTIITPRPREETEVKSFFCCPADRCPVRFFPIDVGDRCPACGGPGVYAGIVAKIPDPQPGDDDEGDGG